MPMECLSAAIGFDLFSYSWHITKLKYNIRKLHHKWHTNTYSTAASFSLLWS